MSQPSSSYPPSLSSSIPIATSSDPSSPPIPPYLAAQFNRAVQIVQGLPKTSGGIQSSYDEKMAMYSLFKQVTEGNVKGSRPGVFDMLRRAKWDAWKSKEGMKAEDGMRAYVATLVRVLKKYKDRKEARDLIREFDLRRSTSASIGASFTAASRGGGEGTEGGGRVGVEESWQDTVARPSSPAPSSSLSSGTSTSSRSRSRHSRSNSSRSASSSRRSPSPARSRSSSPSPAFALLASTTAITTTAIPQATDELFPDPSLPPPDISPRRLTSALPIPLPIPIHQHNQHLQQQQPAPIQVASVFSGPPPPLQIPSSSTLLPPSASPSHLQPNTNDRAQSSQPSPLISNQLASLQTTLTLLSTRLSSIEATLSLTSPTSSLTTHRQLPHHTSPSHHHHHHRHHSHIERAPPTAAQQQPPHVADALETISPPSGTTDMTTTTTTTIPSDLIPSTTAPLRRPARSRMPTNPLGLDNLPLFSSPNPSGTGNSTPIPPALYNRSTSLFLRFAGACFNLTLGVLRRAIVDGFIVGAMLAIWWMMMRRSGRRLTVGEVKRVMIERFLRKGLLGLGGRRVKEGERKGKGGSSS